MKPPPTPATEWSLEQYFGDPLSLPLSRGFDVFPLKTPLNRVLAVPRQLPHVTIHRLQALCDPLIQDGTLPPFRVRMLPSPKPLAYMKDGGDLYFSVGALLSRSPVVTFSVFCHELAHLWLSHQPFYPQMKALNKRFLEHCASVPQKDLLSPIEFYAVLISIDLMNAFLPLIHSERKAKKLSFLIKGEEEKIRLLRSEIINHGNKPQDINF